jgi:hypothetical protein
MGSKMATVKPLERKIDKKECKMHFTSSPAALGAFKLHPKRLREFFFMSSSQEQVAHSNWHIFESFTSQQWRFHQYIYIFLYTTCKMNYERQRLLGEVEFLLFHPWNKKKHRPGGRQDRRRKGVGRNH